MSSQFHFHADFLTTITSDIPISKPRSLNDHEEHHTSGHRLPSRNAIRRKYHFDKEPIPKLVVAGGVESPAITTNGDVENNKTSTDDHSLESSLLDLSGHHTVTASTNVSKSKFLDDFFFHGEPADSSSHSKSGANGEAPLSKLAQSLSIAVRESLTLVCRNGKVTSQPGTGSVSLKLQNLSRPLLTNGEVDELLESGTLSLQAHDMGNSIKSWDISSTLFESIPNVVKSPETKRYDTSIKVVGGDKNAISSSQGLPLYDYTFSRGSTSASSLPIRVQNKLSPKSSSIEFTMTVDFDPTAIAASKREVKFRSTKVQISLASVMAKLSFDDVTMTPSGSFDRNKRVITWLCEDWSGSELSQLHFTAEIKYPADQHEIAANPTLLSGFLPTMVRTQVMDLVSGLAIQKASINDEYDVSNVSKTSQIELKVA